MPKLLLKRIYDDSDPADGFRVLVDRLWPRGISKERAALGLWLREIAPSADLHTWYGHEPRRWPEFQRRYTDELKAHPETIQPILDALRDGPVTILFGARSPQNNAVVLAEYVQTKVKAKRSPR